MANISEQVIKECRICHESGGEELVEPCLCRGTIGYIHLNCLSEWMQTNKQDMCRICGSKFDVEYIKVGHNFWKYLQNEDNRIAFIATILINGGAIFLTFILLEVGFKFWEQLHCLFFFWILIVSIVVIDISILALVIQSWFSLHSMFKWWQKRNYDIVIVSKKSN